MTGPIRVISLLCLLAIAVVQVQAQVKTGTPPLGSFGGGPDIINLANLNSHITIPVLGKAGRGTNFTYDLSYDSSVWYPVGVSGSQTWTPVSNWGWRGSTEVATGYISYTVTSTLCLDSHGNKYFGGRSTYSNWVYHDTFGISHAFSGTTQEIAYPCINAGDTSLITTTGDGSGFKLNAVGPGGNVFSKQGQNLSAPINSGSGAASSIDRNGNEFTVNGSGSFYDTLSATVPVLTISGTGTPASPTVFTYTAPSGSSVHYQANYTNYTVATNFGISGITDYKSLAAMPLVTSIVLPDGAQYTFTYEATPSTLPLGACSPYAGTTCVTARIASVTLPTGGMISYNYYNSNNNFPSCTTGNNGVLSDGSASCLLRVTPDGTWIYTRVQGSGSASTTTISAPQLPYDTAANQTVIQFQGIYQTQRQVYQGSASSGTLLRSWNTCYNGAASPCTATTITLPITNRTIIDQYGSSGVQCKHYYVYNSGGGLTEQDDYDYGTGAPGPLLRQTLVTFAPLGNITAFRQQVTVKNGSGTTIAQTNYNYDEVAPATSSGVVQHTSVTGPRGNLTSVNYPVAGLTSHSTYWDTGSPNTVKDVNNATTTYTYSSNGASCQMAFPTGINEAISGLSQSMTWDCTAGVMTKRTDENSQSVSTTYSDTAFLRPASITDETSVTTNFTYAGQTSLESVLVFNSGNSSVDSLGTLDGLGRVLVRQKRQVPGANSFDSIETDYDAIGRPTRTTLPYSAAAGQTNLGAPAAIMQYDALSRPKRVTDAGNGTVTYSYQNNDVLISVAAPSGENAKQRVLEYDSLGRLSSVCEVTSGTATWPGGTCGQNYSPQATGYWAQYTYDALGDLLTVAQNAQSASNRQTRSYTYDAMGRLTSEKNPEATQTPTTYTYDTDVTCTPASSGDLVKKVDAVGNVTCFAYDTLHRRTAITYPSGNYAASTPAKHFVYDTGTVNGVVMSNAKARLAEAYTCTGSCSTKITDEGFSYSARGEISDMYQSTPNSSGYYHINQTYWPHGAPNQLSQLVGLPTITYGGTVGSTVGLDPEGRITQITSSSGQNPLTGVTYNTAGLPTQVTYGSGDNDIFAYDPNTLRMTQFKFNVGTQPQSLTGNLTWNPNSTLGQLAITDQFNSTDTQTCNYSHDDLIRIASANCGSAASQTFSYDPFGNLDKSGNPFTFQPTYSAATNRITAVGTFNPNYDANGNVLVDSLHSYTWDSDGKPITADNVNLTFDAMDRMVEQNRSGSYTQIVYAPTGAKLAIMNGQSIVKAFVPLPGRATAVYVGSGLDHYRHSDWLGSARLTSGPTRAFISSIAYAPFGETYAQYPQSGTPDLSFTGQNSDTTSGDYDFLFREYSDQGRWASPDPAGLASVDPTNPQTWNRYAYVSNNPLSSTDPLGLFGVCYNHHLFDVAVFFVDGEYAGLDIQDTGKSCNTSQEGGGGSDGTAQNANSQRACVQSPASIPQVLPYGADPTDMLRSSWNFMSTVAGFISGVFGETGGFGVAGGAGAGLAGPFSVGVGESGTLGVQILVDRNGQQAVQYTLAVQIPSLLQNPQAGQTDAQGFSTNNGFGYAANMGFNASINSQTIDQMTQGPFVDVSPSLSGSDGPVGVNVSGTSESVTIGVGVGGRFAGGPTITFSTTVPVCSTQSGKK